MKNPTPSLDEALEKLLGAANCFLRLPSQPYREALVLAVRAGYDVLTADPPTDQKDPPEASTVTACFDCEVEVGELHKEDCDIEICPDCGFRHGNCECPDGPTFYPRLPWTGKWPGEADCEELGWYAVVNPHGPGWIACDPATPGAQHDLHRLHTEAKWDPEQAKFVQRSSQEPRANHQLV